MSKYIIFLGVTVLFLGCSQTQVRDIRARNASNLHKLRIGMSMQDVYEIMGTDTETVKERVYYQGILTGYREVEVSNPYKSEIKQVGDWSYNILYYYADVDGMRMGYWDARYIDRKVTDNVLTPLVFEKDTLIGWGREFAMERKLVHEEIVNSTDWMLWGR